MTELGRFNPLLVVGCFNAFISCINVRDRRVVIKQGLKQLAIVSASSLLRAFHSLSVTDPTSSVLADLHRRYDKVFPQTTSFMGLPFRATMTVMHTLVKEGSSPRRIQWDDYTLSSQEHVPFARYMVAVAQAEYQPVRRGKVPRWILRFALHSLSLDPPPPASVVADCLTIIATDLGCDIFDIMTLNERCVRTQLIGSYTASDLEPVHGRSRSQVLSLRRSKK